MKKKVKEFMVKYLNAYSPTGFEQKGQEIWMDYLSDVATVSMDRFNNAWASISSGDKLVTIEAHADEIAWLVHYIDDKGFIFVKRLGGSDHAITPSMRANILTKSGKIIRGVFGYPAIHIRDDKDEKVPKVEEIFVDLGCTSKKEVSKLGVAIGDQIILDSEVEFLNKEYIIGRALDDKIGGFVNAQVIRQLSKKEFDFELVAVNSSQEEVGLFGAKLAAHKLRPDLAICIDVTHETSSPKMDKIKHGDISFKGCVLTISPQTDQTMNDKLVKVAKKYKIPVQHQVANYCTGTNTDSFAYSRDGIPTILISMPLRYMHTTVEMMSLKTIEGTIDLLVKFLQEGIEECF